MVQMNGDGFYLEIFQNDLQRTMTHLIGIREDAELKALLARYRDTERHMFFGHCHVTLSGSAADIPFSAPRSTNHAARPMADLGDRGRVSNAKLWAAAAVRGQHPCFELSALSSVAFLCRIPA